MNTGIMKDICNRYIENKSFVSKKKKKKLKEDFLRFFPIRGYVKHVTPRAGPIMTPGL